MDKDELKVDSQRLMLFHAVNHVGLGHLSRLTAIALGIRERAPGIPILFLVDGASHGILEAAHLPFLALPPNDFDKSIDGPVTDKIRRLVSSFAASIVQTLHPNLIVFDCFPHRALTFAARQYGVPFAICIRKMKNMSLLSERFIDLLETAELIIFPHTPDEIEVEIPKQLMSKTHFVGTIVRPFRAASEASTTGKVRVVISGGGGGYPGTVNFYNSALAAFAMCRREIPGLSGLLVTGPLFGDWRQLEPVEGIHIIPFDPDLLSVVKDADLVVCQAGYNTVAEIKALDVPAICVPADRAADDQHERAALAALRGSQVRSCVAPDASILARMMIEILRSPRKTVANPICPTGGGRAAELLLALLKRSRPVMSQIRQ
jgi:predicted glycosyltransferase